MISKLIWSTYLNKHRELLNKKMSLNWKELLIKFFSKSILGHIGKYTLIKNLDMASYFWKFALGNLRTSPFEKHSINKIYNPDKLKSVILWVVKKREMQWHFTDSLNNLNNNINKLKMTNFLQNKLMMMKIYLKDTFLVKKIRNNT